MRRLICLLVALAVIGCTSAKEEPAVTQPVDALVLFAERFPAARTWLEGARPAAVSEEGGRWHLRETLGVSATRWQRTRQPLAIEVADGRMTIRSRRGAALTVEREGVVSVSRNGDRLALRDQDGGLTGAIFATSRGLEEVVVGEGSLRYRFELPTGWTMRQPKGREELVELRNGQGVPQLRLSARWAFDEAGERHPLSVRIDGDGVVVEAPGDRGPLLIDPEWQDAGTPSESRSGALTAVMADGTVLLVGGGGGPVPAGQTADRFDPVARVFSTLPVSAQHNRSIGTATPLADGRVLLVGEGFDIPGPVPLEWFDPETEAFVSSEVIWSGGIAPTATRLRSGEHAGKVLLAGGLHISGVSSEGASKAVWLYDPETDSVERLADMIEARGSHRAVQLPDGDLLFVGGVVQDTLASVERYSLANPANNTLLDPIPGGPRHATTALLLHDAVGEAKVLVAGGVSSLRGGGLDDGWLYDPSQGTWEPVTGSLSPPRGSIVATLLPGGDALLLGGGDTVTGTSVSGADRFDVGTGTLAPLAEGPPGNFSITTGTILPGGDVLLLGSEEGPFLLVPDDHAAVPVPDTMDTPMAEPSVTLLATGKALITEGDEAELFEPVTRTFEPFADDLPGIGRWHRATTLPDGRVLYTGGLDAVDQASDAAVIVDPFEGTVSALPKMKQKRAAHLQTLLPSGEVLIVGGVAGWPASGAWQDAELFVDGTFKPLISPVGELAFGRAMLLGDGAVWLWSGFNPLTAIGGLEPRRIELGPLLTVSDGGALPVGGGGAGIRVADGRFLGLGQSGAPQLFDPTGAVPNTPLGGALWVLPPDWSPAMVPLPSGRTLVVHPDEPELALLEPRAQPGETQVVKLAEPLAARWPDAVALMPDGGVLFAGAIGDGPPSDAVALWYENPPRPGWAPTLIADGLVLGESASLAGTGLLGVAEGISATSMAPADAPSVFFLLDDGGIVAGSSTDWTDTEVAWTPSTSAFSGSGIAFASTMGLIGGARAVLAPAATGTACMSSGACDSGRCVDGVCCESACDETCFGCSAAAKGHGDDGVCEPIAADLDDEGCPVGDIASCKQPGTCDGAGQCSPFYPDETLCDEDGERFCYEGECEELVCDGDHTLIQVGSNTDCSPYRCVSEPVASCRTSCGSNLDCVEGFECDPSGLCVAPTASADQLGCIACAVGRRDDEGADLLWLMGLIGWCWRRRERRGG